MSLYYGQIASIYDATRPIPPEVLEQVTDSILRLVSATPETKFLEPGIGTGLIAQPILQRGYSYTGVDISNEMMDELRRKLQGIPNNLTLIQTDASSLPFENNSFDVVLTRHVLHLIPNWQEAVAEIRRVLKPSGFYLYCQSLLTPHQREFEQQWQAILVQQDGYQPTSYSADFEDVQRLLVEQGAAIETVIAAQWRVEQTVGELLDIYQIKPYGSCWQVPADVFPLAMRTFREWCQKHYGSEDVILCSEATFHITVARNWGLGLGG
jgi:ubiquinone/menaquinone biosynthesis C-methylase UbiE